MAVTIVEKDSCKMLIADIFDIELLMQTSNSYSPLFKVRINLAPSDFMHYYRFKGETLLEDKTIKANPTASPNSFKFHKVYDGIDCFIVRDLTYTPNDHRVITDSDRALFKMYVFKGCLYKGFTMMSVEMTCGFYVYGDANNKNDNTPQSIENMAISYGIIKRTADANEKIEWKFVPSWKFEVI